MYVDLYFSSLLQRGGFEKTNKKPRQFRFSQPTPRGTKQTKNKFSVIRSAASCTYESQLHCRSYDTPFLLIRLRLGLPQGYYYKFKCPPSAVSSGSVVRQGLSPEALLEEVVNGVLDDVHQHLEALHEETTVHEGGSPAIQKKKKKVWVCVS